MDPLRITHNAIVGSNTWIFRLRDFTFINGNLFKKGACFSCSQSSFCVQFHIFWRTHSMCLATSVNTDGLDSSQVFSFSLITPPEITPRSTQTSCSRSINGPPPSLAQGPAPVFLAHRELGWTRTCGSSRAQFASLTILRSVTLDTSVLPVPVSSGPQPAT